MLRKHHKFRHGHKVKITKFWPLNKDRLNLHTNPYKISVTQQRFSLLSLGYLWKHFYYLNYFLIIRCGLSLYVLIMFSRLQNSPYFCVFKYVRAVKQKVWNDADNRERETLMPRFTDFFTHFEKKKPDRFTVYMFFSVHARTFLSSWKKVAPLQERQESKSWILDSALWIPDSRYLVPDFLSVKLEFRIPVVSGVPDSLSWN